MTSLLISEIFPPKTGGSGRWFWEIYRRLPREQFVIAAGLDPNQEAFDKGHDLRITRMDLSQKSWGILDRAGLGGYWRAVRCLRQIVAANGITHIHCARCLPEGLMGLALKWRNGIPYACYVHGEEIQYAASSRELSWLVRRVLNGATFIISNSRNSEEILLKDWRVQADRIHVLHPGVDTAKFVPAEPNPMLRQKLGWNDRTVILTVGRLQKRKGHDRMIEALPQIRRHFPDILFAIVGSGEELPHLKALTVRHDMEKSVQFMGELNDQEMVQCYQQCDLFALPNRQVGQDIEGFGMVLLEAQACGKPVLAGKSGGTAETMNIPDTGLTVNCESPEDLAAAVIDLLAEPNRRRRMGESARTWIVENFDWTPQAQKAMELFQKSFDKKNQINQ